MIRRVVCTLGACLLAQPAVCKAQDAVAVVWPTEPTLVVRGELLELHVQAFTVDFLGTAWYRAEKRPPGARAYRGEFASRTRGQEETFVFPIDTKAMPLGDYVFLCGATKMNKALVAAQDRCSVTILERAPVRLVKPANKLATNAPVEIRSEGDAAFPLASVTILKDGEPMAEEKAVSFTRQWDLSVETPGPHTLSLVARDTAGRVYATAPVTILVPANIEVVGIDPNQFYFAQPGAASLALTAKTDEAKIERVEYYLDNAKAGETFLAPWEFSLDCSAVPDGTHAVTARAALPDGKTWTSAPVSLSLVNLNVDPELASIRLGELVAETHRASTLTTDRTAAFWIRYRANKRLRAVWLQRLALGMKVAVTYAASGDMNKRKGAGCMLRDIIHEAGLESAHGAMAAQLAKQYGLSLTPGVRRERGALPEGAQTDFDEYDRWLYFTLEAQAKAEDKAKQ